MFRRIRISPGNIRSGNFSGIHLKNSITGSFLAVPEDLAIHQDHPLIKRAEEQKSRIDRIRWDLYWPYTPDSLYTVLWHL